MNISDLSTFFSVSDHMTQNQTELNEISETTPAPSMPTLIRNTSFQNGSLNTPGKVAFTNDLIHFIVTTANDKVFYSVFLPSMVYLIVLLVTGLPGNAMVCMIYHNKIRKTSNGRTVAYARKSSDIFILALAWLDVLNCALSVPVEIFMVRYFLQFDHQWLCKISRFLSMVFNAASSIVLIGIAADRFIGIKYSHSKYRFTEKVAIKFIIGSIIISLAVSWPGLILYGTMSVPLAPNVVGKTCLIQDRYLTTQYPFFLTMFLLSMHLLFDLFFIVVYSIIGKTVVMNRNSSTFRSKTTTNKKQVRGSISSTEISSIAFSTSCVDSSPSDIDMNKNISMSSIKVSDVKDSMSGIRSNSVQFRRNTKRLSGCSGSDSAVHGRVYQAGKTTFILFAVTIVFMLTFAPYCVIAILRNVSGADFYTNLSNTEKAVYQLFLRSYLLSSSVNPLIYCFLSRKFRQDVKGMLLKTVRCKK